MQNLLNNLQFHFPELGLRNHGLLHTVREYRQAYSQRNVFEDPELKELIQDDLPSLQILRNYICSSVFPDQRTLAHYAITHLNPELLAAVIDGKLCNLNAADQHRFTPLMTLCSVEYDHNTWDVANRCFYLLLNGTTEFKKSLLGGSAKVKLDVRDLEGHTALGLSILSGNFPFAKELLLRKAKASMSSKLATSLLLYFSTFSSDVNYETLPGWATTIKEYKELHCEIAYLLLSRRLSTKKLFYDGSSVLYNSIIYFNFTLFQILLKRPVDEFVVEIRNEKFKRLWQYWNVRSLMKSGANPASACVDFANYSDDLSSRMQFLVMLVEIYPEILNTEEVAKSPLQMALSNMGCTQAHPLDSTYAEYMIEHGADCNYRNFSFYGFKSVFLSSLNCGNAELVNKVIANSEPDMFRTDHHMENTLKTLLDHYKAAIASRTPHLRQYMQETFQVMEVLVQHGLKFECNIATFNSWLFGHPSHTIHQYSLLFHILSFDVGLDIDNALKPVASLVKKAIELGGDVNYHRQGGPNLLMAAVHRNLNYLVKFFLERNASLKYTYKISSCSRDGEYPHRLLTFETLEEFTRHRYGEEFDLEIMADGIICDICQGKALLTESIKMCEEEQCDTHMCEKCFFYDDTVTTDTQVLDIATRRADSSTLNLVNFAHTAVGTSLRTTNQFDSAEVLMNAGVYDLSLLKPKDFRKMGLPTTFMTR